MLVKNIVDYATAE